jgi:hypothetical protein|tara:strand:- start:6061 stop:6669 length:609 start_codon:yes stop_codon:yes gene_type:complete
MISFINSNNKLNENKNSISVTYPRTVNIIFGNYPYPEHLHNMIINIKQNINPDLSYGTNVKAGMTDWSHFAEDPIFNNFLTHLINTHQTSHPDLFQYFLERFRILNAWGNEVKKGESINLHTHSELHGILYLTKGTDLILPELNLKINPEPGNYYLFPPEILHGTEEHKDESNRYCIVFNIAEKDEKWDFKKRYDELQSQNI